jgi:hypothetical protein
MSPYNETPKRLGKNSMFKAKEKFAPSRDISSNFIMIACINISNKSIIIRDLKLKGCKKL